jgi:hypothetical protein
MSTTAATQPILTVIKDKFTEVITEGTLSPTNKPTNWNIVITEKALLEPTRTSSPPPEEIQPPYMTIPFLLMRNTENSLSTASLCGSIL